MPDVAHVFGTAKDDRSSERLVFVGTVAECEDYAERNESPDNFERYTVRPYDVVDDLMESRGKRELAEEVARLRGLLVRQRGLSLVVCEGCGAVIRTDGTLRNPGRKPPSKRHPGA